MPQDASAAPCPPPQPRAPAPALLLSPLCSTSTRTGCLGVRGWGSPKQNGHTARTPKALLVALEAVLGGWWPQKHHQVAGGMNAWAARMYTHLVCSASGKEARPCGVTTPAVPIPPHTLDTVGARYPHVPLGIDESPSLSPLCNLPFPGKCQGSKSPAQPRPQAPTGPGLPRAGSPGARGWGSASPGSLPSGV